MKVNNGPHLNEPQFLSGFRYAKKLLLRLREQQLGNMSPILKDYTHAPPQSSLKQAKTEEINISINRIGKQLEQTYREVEAYEIVFNKLEQYYRSKKHVIEEGELLKIKSRQLKDILADYRRKAELNNQQISRIEAHSQQFQSYVVASLKHYLTELTDCEKLTIAKQLYHPQITQVSPCKISSIEQEEEEEPLELRLKHANWRAEVLAKKAAVKKQKVASKDQSSMQKYYQSQISTI